MMNKLFLYVLTFVLLFNSISYARIRVAGPDELEAYAYSFPQKKLHNSIASLGFIYRRDNLRDPPNKYKASLYIRPKQYGDKTAYVKLEKIELLIRSSAGKNVVVPTIIKSVSMNEYHTLTIDFEYTLTDDLVRLAKLQIYLNIDKHENAKEKDDIIYTVHFKYLRNAK